jgi:hypothetical protein
LAVAGEAWRRSAADKGFERFDFTFRASRGMDLAHPSPPKGGADGERLIATAR